MNFYLLLRKSINFLIFESILVNFSFTKTICGKNKKEVLTLVFRDNKKKLFIAFQKLILLNNFLKVDLI